MHRYIAFLRAINVGGHTVKMEYLRAQIESLGFSKVETFIASGNVIFESPATNTQTLETQIEGHLQQALGYAVATFIRSRSDLAAIADYQPFPELERDSAEHTLAIAFLQAEPSDQARHKLMAFRTDIDDFHIHEREIYWLTGKRMSDSTFSGALLEKTIGMPATMRNATTVRKLAAKYGASD